MDLLEKINRSFGSWYEGLFGGGDDVRPKDILRRILAAMEDHRKEGFDNKVYVPNQYVLEINVHDEAEKEYLLSFLDRDELEAAVRRYCQQNHYHIRGTLDFTVKEVDEPEPAGKRGEKVRVRCRYDSKVTAPARQEALSPPLDDRTVARVGPSWAEENEDGTVPSVTSAALIVYPPDRPPHRYAIARGSVTVGRSARAGNDLVVESDGQMSKRHARFELDSDGRFTLYDLGSTNGSKVNGRRIENRTLHDGDEVVLGATKFIFHQAQEEAAHEGRQNDTAGGPRVSGAFGGAAAMNRGESPGGESNGSSSPPARSLRPRTARLVLLDGDQNVDDFLLASETIIGRGVTNDIVIPDRTVATRHARIVNDGSGYMLECLGELAPTTLNSAPLTPYRAAALKDGDRIALGDITLRFEAGA